MDNTEQGRVLLKLFTVWMIHPDGRITDQGGSILTHQEMVNLLDKVGSFYYTYSDGEITEANNTPRTTPKSEAKDIKHPGIVYLLYSENGLHKIGITSNLKRRMDAFSTSPVNISLVHSFNADDALAAENILHAKYCEQRRRGEWFELLPEQINEIANIITYENNQFIIK